MMLVVIVAIAGMICGSAGATVIHFDIPTIDMFAGDNNTTNNTTINETNNTTINETNNTTTTTTYQPKKTYNNSSSSSSGSNYRPKTNTNNTTINKTNNTTNYKFINHL